MNETQAPAATTAATTTQPVETPATAAAPQQQSGFGMLVPMLLILAIFYFMMIRPQQRREKERRKMIENLRAGAKVVFAGGLMGTIIEATEKTFRIETAPGNVIEVLRSAVSNVVEATTAAAK